MTRIVNCKNLGREAEGLESPPFPGEKGIRIYENISGQAWKEWITLQTMLINEHRPKKFLAAEREKFLFGEGVSVPEGFTAPK